jgi:hypothetical protein
MTPDILPKLSDAAVDSMLDSLPHKKGGAALLLFVGYELTSKQMLRIIKRGDSLVETKRSRGGQSADHKKRALEHIRQLIADGDDEGGAVKTAAAKAGYKAKTLQRYWQLERKPGYPPALKTTLP